MLKKSLVIVFVVSALAVSFVYGKNPEKAKTITIDGEKTETGWLKYSTNDKRYYNDFFYDVFKNEKGNIYELNAKKISGGESEGFGIIFCATGNDINSTSAYVLLITINGQYLVGEIINGKRPKHPVISWKKSSNIRIGYNTANNIKVIDNGNKMTIYFNDMETDSFYKNEKINGKNIGIYHGLGNKNAENFPTEPAEVQFYLGKL